MTAELISQLRDIVGPTGLLTTPDQMAGHLTDWRNVYAGTAAAVVRPATTEEVAAVVARCHAAGVAIVPQGGNTGLCGGAVPDTSGRQVVLSTARMRRIRDLDAANQTITVEAGAVLQSVRDAAAAAGRLFPLSLGAQGSCTVGGNLATNAGGTGVLRYGTMRDLTLGLEVVLPDGRIWNGLRALRKDNTGYDSAAEFGSGGEGEVQALEVAGTCWW
ncbi:FAD binding domain-containing protein [Micromonospora viridifaciens]|uniref:FAD binding domain-containing protein n=1 Tax=Micromonospora viridifaciens TaxID=1881 RepID=A0A1C4XU23_MICVI|nr:FAD-binding oxidoreductase [Micromonospora viridifaciens]SCF12009.1 FAD binding domain-containing protein [Micromonospora viridifaciens]